MKKAKLEQPFDMHIVIDFEGTTESDGEVYTVTQDVIFDQLKYVFEKLQHKGVKIRFSMEMSPSPKIILKKAQG